MLSSKYEIGQIINQNNATNKSKALSKSYRTVIKTTVKNWPLTALGDDLKKGLRSVGKAKGLLYFKNNSELLTLRFIITFALQSFPWFHMQNHICYQFQWPCL